MRYSEHIPAPELRAWVDRYWSLEDPNPGRDTQVVLPDGHPEWVVHLGEPFVGQGGCLAIGQMTGPVSLRASGPVRVFGIRFRPEGAYAFTHVDQCQFTDEIVDLTAIAPHWRELVGNTDPVSATDALLTGLCPQSYDERAATAVNLLVSGARVDETARTCNWSSRQLERTILTRTGLSPKLLARVARFQRALRVRALGLPWSEVAAEAGFTDQSHLIRDFRQFAGRVPSSLENSGLTRALIR